MNVHSGVTIFLRCGHRLHTGSPRHLRATDPRAQRRANRVAHLPPAVTESPHEPLRIVYALPAPSSTHAAEEPGPEVTAATEVATDERKQCGDLGERDERQDGPASAAIWRQGGKE